MASISSKSLGTLIRIADSDGGEGAANYEIADINNVVSGGVVLVRKNSRSPHGERGLKFDPFAGIGSTN